MLAGRLSEWNDLLSDAEAGVRDTITSDFEIACRGYISQRRDFRLASGGPDAADGVHLDLSPALCEPISRLNAEINGLRRSLPPASLRRISLPIAAAVDELLYTQLVRRSSFSVGGARQLARDVSALSALFAPLLATGGGGHTGEGAVVSTPPAPLPRSPRCADCTRELTAPDARARRAHRAACAHPH